MKISNFNTAKFSSQTYGNNMLIKDVINIIVNYMSFDPKNAYSFIIGTDSTGKNDGNKISYISAIIIHKVGKGGIYFWHKRRDIGYSLYERIFKEANMSIELTEVFLNELKLRNIHNFSFEIHVDVGTKGKTRGIVNEVIGMIRAMGHKVVVKPNSFAASKVADKYT
ncbi:hypothetical protein COV24_02650 [candidate division WWE3 bacterium CG10_big_fil_rev_8_21_14_0_10_32_10]|uniref:DUF458 domain-containing protein n=1 Tax=candidate division WWE3 bacterium CG10_big_fil_rev_8_21_14_0_10_32_10 TaxID=1975090 RepID=A0A2H0RAN6_UNCKA|nr:MAG: hypothetical protein COV24_02650 [candidate division WWE3 bacterium CG10_big_fil_rev_8_21_14_0_10_32_10]